MKRRTPAEWLSKTLANCTEEDRGHTTPCLIWQGKVDPRTGYAHVCVEGKTTTRHRMVYEVTNDVSLTRGLIVDHQCNVRACMNPDHLRSMTPAENSRRSRLVTPMTAETVAELKTLRDAGWTYSRLSKRFGIDRKSAYNIYAGYRWA